MHSDVSEHHPSQRIDWGFNIHHLKTVLRLGEPSLFGRRQGGVALFTKKTSLGLPAAKRWLRIVGYNVCENGILKAIQLFAAAFTPDSLLKACTSAPGNPNLLDDLHVNASRRPFSTMKESVLQSPNVFLYLFLTLEVNIEHFRRPCTTHAKRACPRARSPLLLTIAVHLDRTFAVGGKERYD